MSAGGESREEVLREILGALEMPPDGLEKWFAHVEKFCREHGGERHYSELLGLVERCKSELARSEGK